MFSMHKQSWCLDSIKLALHAYCKNRQTHVDQKILVPISIEPIISQLEI